MPAATRIVIAEDEAIIRLDLREMLEEEGYEVVGEAGDGETAMSLTEELRPDLVILDIFMPGVDGLTVAQRIAERGLSAVLILTAFSQRELVDRASRGGAMAYVVKPFEKQDLIPAIELAVARWVETRALGRETKDLAERLETRRLVERAKGILMDRLGMTEHEAFKMIQRAAMRRRVNMREVADRIIRGSLDGLESTR
ncbi:MAG: ANTAR domain-containing response regulator [Actinomycetota bacterium]